MTKIFFATDVHGSERCWKKLVAAGKFYGVDKLILGGDMTGKAVLPLVDYGDGSYKTEFMGKEWILSNNDEIEELEKHIRTNGFYPYKLGSSEFKEMQESRKLQEKVFNKLVIETLAYWLKFADEKLELGLILFKVFFMFQFIGQNRKESMLFFLGEVGAL